jgi:transposase-like protein
MCDQSCEKSGEKTARRFFRRALDRSNTSNPRTIITDQLVSYRGAVRAMKRAG